MFEGGMERARKESHINCDVLYHGTGERESDLVQR